jgi:hypothetical protein
MERQPGRTRTGDATTTTAHEDADHVHARHDAHDEQLADTRHATDHTHEANGHGDHGDHAAHGGHGDHAALFRDRFWLTLLLTVPVVIWSHEFLPPVDEEPERDQFTAARPRAPFPLRQALATGTSTASHETLPTDAPRPLSPPAGHAITSDCVRHGP